MWKVVLALLLTGCLLGACAPGPTGATTASALASANDCNADGVVNTQDLQVVVNAALGQGASACADVNHDGAVNAQDVQAMLNLILGGGSEGGALLWSALPGGLSSDAGAAVAADASGNVYMTGSQNGNYIFLAKCSPAGALLWWQTFQATGAAHGVAVDARGNAFITGEYTASANFGGSWLPGLLGSYSVFVAKISADGSHLWSKGYPGNNFGRGVAVDRNGDVIVTGSFASIDFGAGTMTPSTGGSMYLAKLSSADGAQVWAKQFGSFGARGNGVAVDAAGNLLLTGYCTGTTDFGGGPVSGIGDYQVFVAKLTGDGAHVWSKAFGAMNGSQYGGNEIAAGPNGEVAVTGGFVGSIDFGGGALRTGANNLDTDVFVLELSASGGTLWSKVVGGSASTSDTGYGVAIDGGGNVLVTGQVYGSADFGTGAISGASLLSIFIAKYSPQGACRWAKSLGGNNTGSGIAVDAAGHAIATGAWYGTTDFGAGPVTSVGGTDVFLLEVAP